MSIVAPIATIAHIHFCVPNRKILIYIYKEPTNLSYFPESFCSLCNLTDTTSYDKKQEIILIRNLLKPRNKNLTIILE